MKLRSIPFVAFLFLIPWASVAYAQADVIAQANDATANAWTTWGSISAYGPIWAAALVTFALASKILESNESKHWIAQGRALSFLTTGLMMLGAVLTWKFRGEDTGGLLMSLFLAIKMLVSPTVATATAPSNPAVGSQDHIRTQSGLALLPLLVTIAFVGVLLVAGSGCAGSLSSAKEKIVKIATTVDECAKADATRIETTAADLAVSVARWILRTGNVDWSSIGDQAVADGKDVAWCAVDRLAQFLSAPPPAALARSSSLAAGARSSAAAPVDDLATQAASLRDRLRDRLRAGN